MHFNRKLVDCNPACSKDRSRLGIYQVRGQKQITGCLYRHESKSVPANRLSANDPLFLRDGKMQIFVTQLEHAHSSTIVPMAHDVFWREFYTAQEQIIYGNQSIEQALGTAQTLIQHELDKALSYDEYVRTKMDFFDEK
jgi:hypothetical protein